MPPEPQQVLMLVTNDVTNDTRVKKSALSVARMGFDVTILASSPTGSRVESRMGPVRIIRVPTPLLLRDVAAQRDKARAVRRREWEERLAAWRHGPPPGPRVARATYLAAKREAEAEIALHKARLDALKSQSGRVARARLVVEWRWRWRRIAALRAAVRKQHASNRPERARPWGDRWSTRWERRAGWRGLVPEMHDFERAYGPVMKAVKPDIIHAHDFTTIGMAVRHARIAKAGGAEVAVVYDAHEYTAGVALPDPRRTYGYLDFEEEFIGEVDAVTTVSEPIARRIAKHHGLSRVPDVVLNVPLRPGVRPESRTTVRDVIGLPDGIPLVVYSGGTAPQRRVDLLIEAMAHVPGAHLVVVCSDPTRLTSFTDLARGFGLIDRFHLVPYAPGDEVAHYLSGADVAVHPLSTDHANHQLALPNKLFEYLHAGLPVVVSDNPTMASFVQKWGIGEVFPEGGPEALAASIREVLSNVDRYAPALNDHKLLERHTWEGQEPVLVEVYERVTGLDLGISDAESFTLVEDHPSTAAVDRRAPRRDAALRLAIGPTNMAGQAWEWARALDRTAEDVSTEVFAIQKRYGFQADTTISPEEWSNLEWQLEMVRRVLSTHTHVLFEACQPIFGRLNGSTFDHDVPALLAHGIVPGVVLHGSEVRDPRIHRQLEPYSPFGLGADEWTKARQSWVDHVAPRLASFSGTTFVATTGLLDFVPEARWLPVAVDMETWKRQRAILDHDGPPVVVHASTSSRLKGSDHVTAICEELQGEGLISFRRVQDVPYGHMPNVIEGADVLIDGLLLGDYGVTACQGLAAGRVVVGNVAERVRRRISGPVPIRQADPVTLRDVLVELAEDREHMHTIAKRGQDFVGRFHDGSYAAGVLVEWMRATRP